MRRILFYVLICAWPHMAYALNADDLLNHSSRQLPDDCVSKSSGLLPDIQNKRYAVEYIECHDDKYFLLERKNPTSSNKPNSEIFYVKSLVIREGEDFIQYPFCSDKENANSTVFAVGQWKMPDKYQATVDIRKAWILNRETLSLDEIPKERVECGSDGW